jgi:uncharacterized membrane protein YkvA (DUF1232 family)
VTTEILVGAAAALVATWLLLVLALVLARPRGGLPGEAARILPDLLRLLRRLAADSSLPRGVRVRLWLMLGYLATPIDLVPDFLPVVGYVDDVIIMVAALRSVVRRAGPEAVCRHWPGTRDGLTALARLARLPLGAVGQDGGGEGGGVG